MKFIKIIMLGLIFGLFFSACTDQYNNINESMNKNKTDLIFNDIKKGEVNMVDKEENKTLEDYEVATFSGGCFWCSEAAFEAEEGIFEVISGYVNGDEINPTYEQVSSGKTSYREGVQVYFDPDKTSYDKLLEVYWKHIDPTQEDGQFNDKGFHYTTAIYYHNDSQREMAENSKKMLAESGKFDKPITTVVLPFTSFYPAEEYHQDYYKKRTAHYSLYAAGSGRKGYIEDTWKDDSTFESEQEEEEEENYGWDDPNFEMPTEEELKKILTPLQYKITREEGTERAFENEYWDNKEEGIYVDLISGAPLYSSTDKFDSGTGWPSFTKPIDEGEIEYREDRKLFVTRTEVRSTDSDSHLGHVFNDAPKELGGVRHCINSAALKFIPKEDLEKEGYEKYLSLFEN